MYTYSPTLLIALVFFVVCSGDEKLEKLIGLNFDVSLAREQQFQLIHDTNFSSPAIMLIQIAPGNLCSQRRSTSYVLNF
jgi:hypothetical protein